MDDEWQPDALLDSRVDQVRNDLVQYIESNSAKIDSDIPIFFGQVLSAIDRSLPDIDERTHDQLIDDITVRILEKSSRSTDLDYIEKLIGAEDVKVFNDQVGTFQALLGKQIDATVISLPTALYATAVQIPDATIAAILPHDPNDLGHGLVFEKGNPIVDWIDKGLEAIIADGVIEDLTAEYLVGDETIPTISK